MKVIDIPELVILPTYTKEGEKKPTDYPFGHFLEECLIQYQALGTGGRKGIKQAKQIWEVVDGLHNEGEQLEDPPKSVQFETDDFDVVFAASEKAIFKPAAFRCLESYYDALEKAQDVKKPVEPIPETEGEPAKPEPKLLGNTPAAK